MGPGDIRDRALAFLRLRLDEVVRGVPSRAWPEDRDAILEDLEARAEGLPCMVSLHDIREIEPVWFNPQAMKFFGFEEDWVGILDHSFYLQTTHPSNTVVFLEATKYLTGDRSGSLDLLYCLKCRTGEYKRVWGSSRPIAVDGHDLAKSPLMLMFQIPEAEVELLGAEITPAERSSAPREKNVASPVWHRWRRRIFEERAREYGLTPREMEVVEWVVQGRSDGEIAEGLKISRRTAEKHVSNVLLKCKAANRRALNSIWDDGQSRFEVEGSGMLRQQG